MAVRLQGFAQIADVHVDRALTDMQVSAPNQVEKLCTAVNPVRMGHQEV